MEFQPVVITTTSDEKTVLRSIASHLLENRAAACVQISGPVTSYYRWQGKIQESKEWQCLIKTDARHFEAIKTVIHELHNYDEPQLVAFEIANGSAGYLKWIKANTD